MAITSRVPPNAPTGSPPPMIFPRAGRSGEIPNVSCAPPKATPKPGITSSKKRGGPRRAGDLPQFVQKTRGREDHPHVSRDRFDDHGGDLPRILFEEAT